MFSTADVLSQRRSLSSSSIGKIKEISSLLGSYPHHEQIPGAGRRGDSDFQSRPCLDSHSTGEIYQQKENVAASRDGEEMMDQK